MGIGVKQPEIMLVRGTGIVLWYPIVLRVIVLASGCNWAGVFEVEIRKLELGIGRSEVSSHVRKENATTKKSFGRDLG